MKQSAFEKTLGQTLKFKLVGSRKKYFVTEGLMPKQSKKAYEDRLVEMDDEAQEVEDILGDIAASPNDEFNAARLENLKMRTAVLQQKLEEQKASMWSEWNEAFFEAFTEAFSKFKNDLISLHLGEEQLSILTEKLENALKLMQDKLDAMWNKFSNDEDEEGEKK